MQPGPRDIPISGRRRARDLQSFRCVFPLKACLADEANIGFVNQRRRLQRLVPALVS